MKSFFKAAGGILLAVAAILLILTAIRNINRRPSMVLTSETCKAPCWYGIQPGVTDSWTAFETLSQIEGINVNSIMGEYDRDDQITSYYWYFQRPAEDSAGSVTFANDLVTAISILTVDSLNLGDFLDKFGEPEKYWAQIGRGENRDYLTVMLFHPENGYAVEVVIDFEAGAKQVEIKESTPVMRVTFFDPEKYQQLLQTTLLIEQPFAARTGSFVEWKGYGFIDIE